MSKDTKQLKKKCPHHWEALKFEEVFQDKTAGNIKIKKKDYLNRGALPVIDQGREIIGGYVEDETLACKESLPSILFGDHTKIFKYIPFPFALGADGVKVLSPSIGFDKRFLFHYLNTIKLPDNAGYSRHYKYLKRMTVPKPPLSEQQRIAAILDKADAIRRKRQAAIQMADDFLRAVFLDMFGDPVTNPKGWEKKKIGELAVRITKGESPKWQGFKYQEEGVLFVTSENVLWGKLDKNKKKFIPNSFHSKLKRSQLKSNDLLINLVGASVGRACLVPFEILPSNINQAVSVITFNNKLILPSFALQQILTPQIQLSLIGKAVEFARANISLANIKELEIVVPPINKQKTWIKLKAEFDLIRKNQNRLNTHETTLFDSISQRAFRGEL